VRRDRPKRDATLTMALMHWLFAEIDLYLFAECNAGIQVLQADGSTGKCLDQLDLNCAEVIVPRKIALDVGN
jgi:hypothetical protein